MKYKIYLLSCGWFGAALVMSGFYFDDWQWWLLYLSALAMSGFGGWSAREDLLNAEVRK